MSDVNAVIVQPFKQFVKARRAASKTSIAGTPPPHNYAAAPSRDASRKHTPTRAPNAGFVGFFVKLVHIPINNILMT